MKPPERCVWCKGIERAVVLTAALFALALSSGHTFAELIPISVWPTNTVVRTGSGASFEVAISPDARFLLFASSANNLVTNDVGGANLDLFLRDRTAERTTIISPAAIGKGGGNGTSIGGQLTDDGRFVVFQSLASNLVANDTNGVADVFLRDVQLGTTELVSRGVGGIGDADSSNPTVSNDGHFVAFESSAANLGPGDTNSLSDVFVYDASAKAVSLVSGAANGFSLSGTESHAGQITSDGKAVIFWSKGSNLVTGAASLGDVYYRDLAAGLTYWVSTNAQTLISSTFASSNSPVNDLAISLPEATPDGRYIAYKMSFAFGINSTRTFVARHDMSTFTTLLVATNANDSSELNDPNLSISADGKRIAYSGGGTNIYVWDAETAESTVVNLNADGTGPGNGGADSPRISADGAKVVFLSDAQDLVSQETDEFQIYLRDLTLNSTYLINVGLDNTGADVQGSTAPFLSADGRYVFFSTPSDNIVEGDQNDDYDVFVRDVTGGSTELTSAVDSSSHPQIAPGLCADCGSVASDDGNFVIFTSSEDLTTIPVFGIPNLYRRDISNQVTELVSISSDGLRGANFPCFGASLSGNGNVVAFVSFATNLTDHAPNQQLQAFARNISSKTTTLVSVDQNGARAGAGAIPPNIDFEGRHMFFIGSGNLINPSLPPGNTLFYMRDLITGDISQVGPYYSTWKVTSDGHFAANIDFGTVHLLDLAEGRSTNYSASSFSFSHNSGFFVAVLRASATVPSTTVLVRDLQQNIETSLSLSNVTKISISDDGKKVLVLSPLLGGGPVKVSIYDNVAQSLADLPIALAHLTALPLFSPNGRYLACETASSGASAANDSNSFSDVALYDTQLHQLRLISVSPSTGFAADSLSIPLAVFDDGSIVFESAADDLGFGGTFGVGSMYLYRNTLTDTDHDGLDDLLEMSLFGSLAQDATGDFDGDGISNEAEIAAGKNPAAPYFSITSFAVSSLSSQIWNITWKAIPGGQFRVQYKHSLDDAAWTDASGIMTVLPGTTSLSFSDPSGPTDMKYYRVVQLH